MILSGNASDYTLTVGYLKYGRKSTRTALTGTAYFNVNVLCAPGALLMYEPELPHFEEQNDQFDKYKATGLFGSVGFKTPVWDLDSGDKTDASAQQESSMLVLTSRT
jgi:hypothetical protein